MSRCEGFDFVEDSFGRKIDYARVSLTDRCNLRCVYCMPETGVDKKECGEILRYEQIDEIIKALVALGIKKIRFTGGEPLVRAGAADFITQCIKKYNDIGFYITTNASFLGGYAKQFKEAGLKGVNISLDSLSLGNYKSITRGGDLYKALEGLHKAMECGLPKIKVNSVLIKGTPEGQLLEIANLTLNYPIDVRFIELMPIGSCAAFARENYMKPDILFDIMPGLKPVSPEDASSPAAYFKLPGAKGKIGLINPISCKFCHSCNRIRVTADGKIKHCLHSDEEFDLLNGGIREIILKAASLKPEGHNMEDRSITRDMKRIGG
ncbi:MAG: GTP 3',8-cyclase MoaA [Clostridiales bacterium]|jgi:cyclic pyranopterin phosphate synthase|nr:GTP 3',8-cyclase MoaA [Clostridiales bacterium]